MLERDNKEILIVRDKFRLLHKADDCGDTSVGRLMIVIGEVGGSMLTMWRNYQISLWIARVKLPLNRDATDEARCYLRLAEL
jgi:hypothetical protein